MLNPFPPVRIATSHHFTLTLACHYQKNGRLQPGNPHRSKSLLPPSFFKSLKASVGSRFNPCEICVGRSDTGEGFSRIIRTSGQLHHRNVPQSLSESTVGEVCEPPNKALLFLIEEKPWKENELHIVSSRRVTFLAPFTHVTKANKQTS